MLYTVTHRLKPKKWQRANTIRDVVKKRKTVLQILPSVITDIYFFKPNLMGNITMTITKLRLYPELGPAQPQLG